MSKRGIVRIGAFATLFWGVLIFRGAGEGYSLTPRDYAGKPLSREEVILKLAGFARDFAREQEAPRAAEILRQSWKTIASERGVKIAEDPGKIARWLKKSDAASIAEAFRDSPRLMSETVEGIIVYIFGIRFHYINADGDELYLGDCADLDGVIARLINYPSVILQFLGSHGLDIYLYAPDADSGCYMPDGSQAAGCADTDIRLNAGNAWATVHETGHTIERLMVLGACQDVRDPDMTCDPEINPLAPPAKWEFYDLFDDYPGVDYSNHTLVELPRGFVSNYALVDAQEDFAETCEYYVNRPDWFLGEAKRQALSGEPLLYRKYLFVRRHVFLGRAFGEISPPEIADITVRAVDRGDGDGRIEPGETFSLRVDLLPVVDIPDAVSLICTPDPEGGIVAAPDGEEAVDGLSACQPYHFVRFGEYRLSEDFDREANWEFTIECQRADGSRSVLGTAAIPLNEQGYLWFYASDLPGGDDCGKIVKMASTLEVVDAIPLPDAMKAYGMAVTAVYRYQYDPRRDQFWFLPLKESDPLVRFDPRRPGSHFRYEVDPDGVFDTAWIADFKYNPCDGSLWFIGQRGTALRINLLADGRLERRVVAMGSFLDWAIHPWSGAVWFTDDCTLKLYSPSGDLRSENDDMDNAAALAAERFGGCWVGSSYNLHRISPDGALESFLPPAEDYRLICHPHDCSLWAQACDSGAPGCRLIRFRENGWRDARVEENEMDVHLWPADGSVFIRQMGETERIDRYFADGSYREGKPLPFNYCWFEGFQTRVAPDMTLRQGETPISDGRSSFDFGNLPVGTPRTVEFVVGNSGSADLVLGAIGLSGAGEGDFLVAAAPIGPIPPGGEGVVSITFTPAALGSRAAAISIAGNDPGRNPYTFNVYGRGTGPDINVKAGEVDLLSGSGTYDFGTLPAGTVKVVDFTVENAGFLEALTPGNCTIGGADPDRFSVSRPPPVSIGAGFRGVLSVTFRPAAPGESRAVVSIPSNDPDRGENPYTFTVTGRCGAPDIDVTGGGLGIVSGSGSYDFGNIVVGKTGSPVEFVIRNAGQLDLMSWAIQLTGEDKGMFRIQGFEMERRLRPGESVSFTVSFAPAAPGARAATVLLYSNDPDAAENPYTFALRGTGVVPDINVKQGAANLPSGKSGYSYGEVRTGTARDAVFTIQNTGTARLSLIKNGWSIGGAGAAYFSVVSSPSLFVAPGASTTMKIRFSPLGLGLKSAQVILRSDDPDEGTYTFGLGGTGVK